MSLVRPDSPFSDEEGPQTIAELTTKNKTLVLQLKQSLDTVDDKNKRIQELENKCLEYESLLTKQAEQAFDSFDNKLDEFKTHHAWTVKQLLLQHEALVKRVEARLRLIPRQKQRIYEQKTIIEELRHDVRKLKTQYHVQELDTMAAKMKRTSNQYEKNKQRLLKVENQLRLSRQTTDDQKARIEKLVAQNSQLTATVNAYNEKATRREATKYVDVPAVVVPAATRRTTIAT